MHLLEELGSHGPIVAALLVVMATFLALRVLRSGPAGRKGSGGQAAGKRSSAACPAAAAATAAKAGSAAAAPAPARYLPFSANLSAEDVLVVDCTHPACRTLTHHKGHCNPPLAVVPGADTSTALVLNALRAQPQQAAALEAWLGRPAHVSCNHFDADAVLSMWCVLNPEDALRHEAVLRNAARIGDFREVPLGEGPLRAAALQWDGVDGEAQVLLALKLNCWINSVERARFSPPFDDKDADEKFAYFLGALLSALEDIKQYRPEWEAEYEEVLSGWRLLEEGAGGAGATLHTAAGLAVVRSPRPLHYYCLFSHAIGADVVLSIYPGNRYEVESRYTQFINLWSRPATARLDLKPLAELLNEVDTGREAGTHWAAPGFVDTGPLLRLDRNGQKLSKMERYGSPTARPHFASSLRPADFEALVRSYLEFGLRGLEPKVGGWSWEELQALNERLDWEPWRAEARRRWGS